MSPEDKKRTLRRRQMIALIIVLIIITILHLWELVIGFGIIILVIAGFMWIIDWVCGGDLYGDPNDNHLSNEERTMWDIFTLNQIFNHHDDNNHIL